MNVLKPEYIPDWIVDQHEFIISDLENLEWLNSTEARKEYFMSNEKIDYTYGTGPGQRTYSSNPVTHFVQCMFIELAKRGHEFNACFLNRYDTQKNQLGWHSDVFEGMDSSYEIAVVSLGAEREIWWRENNFKGVIPKENRQLLQNGSLFIMPKDFQLHYQHRIPRHDRECGMRISLTFRKFSA